VYESARSELVRAYWQIGEYIVQAEQGGNPTAQHGAKVIARLADDLSVKYGSGFSRPNLTRMRQFYLRHRTCSTSNTLTWAHHVELLGLKDTHAYDTLVRRITDEKLTVREVRKVVQEVAPKPFRARYRQLTFTRGQLWTYKVLDRPCARGEVVLDCGFHIERPVLKSECKKVTIGEPSYTYTGSVEDVIDGDTVHVRIDCGFQTFTRESVRLRGLDTPELGTPEGELAKRFVKKRLMKNDILVIKTYATDMYHRYIADLFYLPDEIDPQTIVHNGIYLNQELLDAGLAR